MSLQVNRNDIFGLIHPGNDAHTLGISAVANLLEELGYKAYIADMQVCSAISLPEIPVNISIICNWIQTKKITRLGFSYRLDPKDAQINFGRFMQMLRSNNQLKEHGGSIIQIYFAGLPEACRRIKQEYNDKIPVFNGDESLFEVAKKLDISDHFIPNSVAAGTKYDDDRMLFAREIIEDGEYHFFRPRERVNYSNYGTRRDTIVERINFNQNGGSLPLIRAHVGPYNHNYEEAKNEFLSWLKTLSETRYLDIVSIATSQLSQSDFNMDWKDKPNGGGVPINSEKDLLDIYNSSRPMLVRTYAGTHNIPYLADVYERTINIAWHALSFWWFSQIDGRGPYSVKQNLEQHFETLRYIAQSGKPFEPNIPHHFAFRGSDDASYVLSAYLAAKTAKLLGIRYLILQIMLNTPKHTWGTRDLAKARVLLKLVRQLEDKTFRIFVQPRTGLDYLSSDIDKAKIQLAAVTAMMDDIEPDNQNSPDIIHVVSYSEAVNLASPTIINESIQITLTAISQYKKRRIRCLMDNKDANDDVNERTAYLYYEVRGIIELIEKRIPFLYSPDGLHSVFKIGVMPVPYLWEKRDEFPEAVKWETKLINGGIEVIDKNGKIIKPFERIKGIIDKLPL